jgi:hypothetical protein
MIACNLALHAKPQMNVVTFAYLQLLSRPPLVMLQNSAPMNLRFSAFPPAVVIEHLDTGRSVVPSKLVKSDWTP